MLLAALCWGLFMFLTREAIKSAQHIVLPDQGLIFTFTDYDKKIWQKAFDWYNEHMNLPKVDMSNRAAFSKVFGALKKAKDFPMREDKI